MTWLRDILRKWLGFPELEARVLDLERHFVTKRNEQGLPTETLADVPLADRKDRRLRTAGMSWPQRQRIYEATDGGRVAATSGK